MRESCAVIILSFALCTDALADCTPQMVADLQRRGAAPQLIAQICGGPSGGQPMSNVCATNVGFCPYRGPVNSPCTCPSQMGNVQGVGR